MLDARVLHLPCGKGGIRRNEAPQSRSLPEVLQLATFGPLEASMLVEDVARHRELLPLPDTIMTGPPATSSSSTSASPHEAHRQGMQPSATAPQALLHGGADQTGANPAEYYGLFTTQLDTANAINPAAATACTTPENLLSTTLYRERSLVATLLDNDYATLRSEDSALRLPWDALVPSLLHPKLADDAVPTPFVAPVEGLTSASGAAALPSEQAVRTLRVHASDALFQQELAIPAAPPVPPSGSDAPNGLSMRLRQAISFNYFTVLGCRPTTDTGAEQIDPTNGGSEGTGEGGLFFPFVSTESLLSPALFEQILSTGCSSGSSNTAAGGTAAPVKVIPLSVAPMLPAASRGRGNEAAAVKGGDDYDLVRRYLGGCYDVIWRFLLASVQAALGERRHFSGGGKGSSGSGGSGGVTVFLIHGLADTAHDVASLHALTTLCGLLAGLLHHLRSTTVPLEPTPDSASAPAHHTSAPSPAMPLADLLHTTADGRDRGWGVRFVLLAPTSPYAHRFVPHWSRHLAQRLHCPTALLQLSQAECAALRASNNINNNSTTSATVTPAQPMMAFTEAISVAVAAPSGPSLAALAATMRRANACAPASSAIDTPIPVQWCEGLTEAVVDRLYNLHNHHVDVVANSADGAASYLAFVPVISPRRLRPALLAAIRNRYALTPMVAASLEDLVAFRKIYRTAADDGESSSFVHALQRWLTSTSVADAAVDNESDNPATMDGDAAPVVFILVAQEDATAGASTTATTTDGAAHDGEEVPALSLAAAAQFSGDVVHVGLRVVSIEADYCGSEASLSGTMVMDSAVDDGHYYYYTFVGEQRLREEAAVGTAMVLNAMGCSSDRTRQEHLPEGPCFGRPDADFFDHVDHVEQGAGEALLAAGPAAHAARVRLLVPRFHCNYTHNAGIPVRPVVPPLMPAEAQLLLPGAGSGLGLAPSGLRRLAVLLLALTRRTRASAEMVHHIGLASAQLCANTQAVTEYHVLLNMELRRTEGDYAEATRRVLDRLHRGPSEGPPVECPYGSALHPHFASACSPAQAAASLCVGDTLLDVVLQARTSSQVGGGSSSSSSINSSSSGTGCGGWVGAAVYFLAHCGLADVHRTILSKSPKPSSISGSQQPQWLQWSTAVWSPTPLGRRVASLLVPAPHAVMPALGLADCVRVVVAMAAGVPATETLRALIPRSLVVQDSARTLRALTGLPFSEPMLAAIAAADLDQSPPLSSGADPTAAIRGVLAVAHAFGHRAEGVPVCPTRCENEPFAVTAVVCPWARRDRVLSSDGLTSAADAVPAPCRGWFAEASPVVVAEAVDLPQAPQAAATSTGLARLVVDELFQRRKGKHSKRRKLEEVTTAAAPHRIPSIATPIGLTRELDPAAPGSEHAAPCPAAAFPDLITDHAKITLLDVLRPMVGGIPLEADNSSPAASRTCVAPAASAALLAVLRRVVRNTVHNWCCVLEQPLVPAGGGEGLGAVLVDHARFVDTLIKRPATPHATTTTVPETAAAVLGALACARGAFSPGAVASLTERDAAAHSKAPHSPQSTGQPLSTSVVSALCTPVNGGLPAALLTGPSPSSQTLRDLLASLADALSAAPKTSTSGKWLDAFGDLPPATPPSADIATSLSPLGSFSGRTAHAQFRADGLLDAIAAQRTASERAAKERALNLARAKAGVGLSDATTINNNGNASAPPHSAAAAASGTPAAVAITEAEKKIILGAVAAAAKLGRAAFEGRVRGNAQFAFVMDNHPHHAWYVLKLLESEVSS